MGKDDEKGGGRDPHGNNMVTVTIDEVPKDVHRGAYLTAELKTLLGVDATRDLDIIEDGVFRPLQPTERTTVKDGMIFASRQTGGGSS